MADPRHDWYAAQWLKFLGKSQADVARDLDWNKAKVSLTVRGMQPYDRDDLNELADYLHVEPFELLMMPERAMGFRQYRASAEQVLALATEETEPLSFKDRSYDPARHKESSRKVRKTGTHE